MIISYISFGMKYEGIEKPSGSKWYSAWAALGEREC